MAERCTNGRGWLLAMALWAAMGPVGAQAVVQDDRGVPVTFASAPQRIVSLLPAITEMVCALGACDRLVGVDRHSNHPPQVLNLPKLGGMDDTPLEALIQLKPDLVLVAGSTRLMPRMKSLGLRVMAYEPHDEADARRMGLALSRILWGSDERWQAHEKLQAQRWHALAQGVNPAMKGARVYIEVGEGPYVAADSSFIGQALKRVGLASAVPGTWGLFPRLSPEWVLREQPDWVVISSTALAVQRRAGWRQLQALRHNRVCVLQPGEMDMLVRPGPRLVDGIASLVACMQKNASP
jgi:iron complex transport system substrate-binding protein